MAIPAEQQPTAALLQQRTGSPPIETHISALFIGADEVWKLRKAVRMPFLDFSSLPERHRTALRELELNAPHAPGLYHKVVPITRGPDGTLTLGGDGEPVDWVVRMARVPPADFFDAIAARNALTPVLLDALADAVAAYHDALPPVAKDQTVALRDIIRGNQLSANAAGIDSAVAQRWTDTALAALATLDLWLRAREAAGYVRRAHGDLHLGNLCMWRGVPVPFDALEFNEDLATIDLGYDFPAFLLMDLDTRVGRAAANRVLNRYLARTGDWGMLTGMPLFQSVRAMVRAHIAAARPGGRLANLPRARVFISAAKVENGGGDRWLNGHRQVHAARALAPGLGPAPGALVLSSDQIRKRLLGVAPEAKLPPAAYTEAASQEVFATMLRAVAGTVTAGHAVIADATFMDPRLRDAVRRAAGDARFQGVWLQAPMAVLEARVAERRGDASDADVTVLRRAARGDPGPGDWLAVDATETATALALLRASTSA